MGLVAVACLGVLGKPRGEVPLQALFRAAPPVMWLIAMPYLSV